MCWQRVVASSLNVLILFSYRYEHRRDYRFDTWEDAMLTLFEVLTLEGWLDVRNLFDKESDVLKDSPFSWVSQSWRDAM